MSMNKEGRHIVDQKIQNIWNKSTGLSKVSQLLHNSKQLYLNQETCTAVARPNLHNSTYNLKQVCVCVSL